MKYLQQSGDKTGFNARWLVLIAVSILLGSMWHAAPARATDFVGFEELDVDCGSGLHLREATGVPGATVHTYAFGGACNLRVVASNGPRNYAAPPLVASAHWDQASNTYTESLHLLASATYTNIWPGVSDVHVDTYPEVASFKCDVDPVINRGAHCTLISQNDATGWHSKSGPYVHGGDQVDGFAWKANHNRPELLGLATAAQAAALSRNNRHPYISCTGLKLSRASYHHEDNSMAYQFDGTCELYHTADGSGGLRLTPMLVTGRWFANGKQAQESFFVLVPASQGGGFYKNANYTCSANPFIHANVQCSLQEPIEKVPAVYDPISDLRAKHPIAADRTNPTQVAQLLKGQSKPPKHAVELSKSGAGYKGNLSASHHVHAHLPTPPIVYSVNHHRSGSVNASQHVHVPTPMPKVSIYGRKHGAKTSIPKHNHARRFGSALRNNSTAKPRLPAVQQHAMAHHTIRFGGKLTHHPAMQQQTLAMHTLSAHLPAHTQARHDVRTERYRSVAAPRLKLLKHRETSARGCANLGKLITIQQTLYNSGGPLAAGQAKLFVQEHGGAHIQSQHIKVPAMAHGAKRVLTLQVGTQARYRAKVPGTHQLTVSLTQKGKTTTSMLMARLPAGFCQPVRHQMHVLRERPVIRKNKSVLKLNPQPEPPAPKPRMEFQRR